MDLDVAAAERLWGGVGELQVTSGHVVLEERRGGVGPLGGWPDHRPEGTRAWLAPGGRTAAAALVAVEDEPHLLGSHRGGALDRSLSVGGDDQPVQGGDIHAEIDVLQPRGDVPGRCRGARRITCLEGEVDLTDDGRVRRVSAWRRVDPSPAGDPPSGGIVDDSDDAGRGGMLVVVGHRHGDGIDARRGVSVGPVA